MGNNTKKKPSIHDLAQKIDKRPTLLTTVTLLVGVAGIIISLSTFIMGKLLSAQSDTLKAQTTVCVLEAMEKHNEVDRQTWADRKETLIKEILVYLNLQPK
jgi:hypothetical protein